MVDMGGVGGRWSGGGAMSDDGEREGRRGEGKEKGPEYKKINFSIFRGGGGGRALGGERDSERERENED